MNPAHPVKVEALAFLGKSPSFTCFISSPLAKGTGIYSLYKVTPTHGHIFKTRHVTVLPNFIKTEKDKKNKTKESVSSERAREKSMKKQ